LIKISALASGSKGNCYRVTDSRTPLLLECGISIQKIKKGVGFKLADIAGCLVTHEHQDHCKAAADITRAGIDTYMSAGTAWALIETASKDSAIFAGHRVKIKKALEQFKVGTWTILPFATQHDAKEPLGFLLANQEGDKLLYATDTYYIQYRFQDLTHIMIECNYAKDILQANVRAGLVPAVLEKRLLTSHFSLENVKEFLKANDLSRVREIWLLHLSDQNSDAERFKREVQELTGKPVFVAG